MQAALGLVRRIGLPVSMVVGAVLFFVEVNRHYAIQNWLVWRYVACWLWMALFVAAAAASGDALNRRLLPGLGGIERLAGAFSTGAFLFFLGMFVGGLLGLYGPVFFLALPMAMLAPGRSFARFAIRLG